MYSEEYLSRQQSDKKGKFFEFIQKIDKLDATPTPSAGASTQDYDISELDISFDKVSSKATSGEAAKASGVDGAQVQAVGSSVAVQSELKLTEEQIKLRSERELQIQEAKRKYNISFFKNFAFSGPDQLLLSQKALEEYIMNLENPADIQALVISLIHSSYELNALIPNSELLFYKLFCSPLTTKDERQGKDRDSPLVGNLFPHTSVTYHGYRSLLETLVLEPKKKHFKKVLAHLIEHEPKEKLDPVLISLIVRIGIDQKYPVLLGKTMKHFMQNDYRVPKRAFQDFVLFLERCKGYEEDSKRFIFLTAETETLDFSYDLVRPIFLRNMSLKTGNEVLQLFEQIRKNIRLNKAAQASPEKAELLNAKKREFYDGLLKDLISKKAFDLGQIVYSEKQREKFEQTISDQLTGLEIFSAQRKIDEFADLYGKLLAIGEKDKAAGAGVAPQFTQEVCESIARTLMEFDSEKEKQRRLEMAEKLFKRILEN